MKTITDEDINSILDEIEQSEENPFDSLFDDFDSQQPVLTDYLMGIEDEEFTSDERDLMINCVLMGWYIITKAIGEPGQVEEKTLDSNLDRNIALLESAEDDDSFDGEDEEAFIDLFARYNDQKELMAFLMGLVFNLPDEERENVSDDAVLAILIHVKTGIDSLLHV